MIKTSLKYSITVNYSITRGHNTRPEGFLEKNVLHLSVTPHKAPWELGMSFAFVSPCLTV